MRVTLHDYVSDPTLTQKDGANLAHENIATLMRSAARQGVEASFHDFNRLLTDDDYARQVLSDTECVVSNVGPHAHYYFYLRQRYNLDFRIIRDVRTALWSSYLHQEHLVQPYLRTHDVLMVASQFTRGIYEAMFPHLRHSRIIICYPLTVAFPDDLPKRTVDAALAGETFTLGYIGRLSEDKNFPDIVDLLIHLNRRYEKQYRLIACGDLHSSSCHPERVKHRIRNALGDDSCFEYLPARPNDEVWELYSRFDAMLFPSTSNLETLGRVLIEASYAGVPVVCGEHAATSELMPASVLCKVDYTARKRFYTHADHALGRIDITDMARVLTAETLALPACHAEYETHASRFFHELTNTVDSLPGHDSPGSLTASQKAFIEQIRIDLPHPISSDEADTALSELIPWFLGLQERKSPNRHQLLEKLLNVSKDPDRTQRFIRKTSATRCDFTDIGGIDMELCHITGFYPHFQIGEASLAPCTTSAAG